GAVVAGGGPRRARPRRSAGGAPRWLRRRPGRARPLHRGARLPRVARAALRVARRGHRVGGGAVAGRAGRRGGGQLSGRRRTPAGRRPRPASSARCGRLRAGAPEAWEALGFTLVGGVAPIGGVRIRLNGSGGGISGWSLRGLARGADLDGLPSSVSEAPPPEPVTHAVGAVAVDHVVALTPDLDRTAGT